MEHDFYRRSPYIERYDKNRKPCSSINGIMDSTESRKSLWSTCSVEDFKKYYSGLSYLCVVSIAEDLLGKVR